VSSHRSPSFPQPPQRPRRWRVRRRRRRRLPPQAPEPRPVPPVPLVPQRVVRVLVRVPVPAPVPARVPALVREPPAPVVDRPDRVGRPVGHPVVVVAAVEPVAGHRVAVPQAVQAVRPAEVRPVARPAEVRREGPRVTAETTPNTARLRSSTTSSRQHRPGGVTPSSGGVCLS
jgi:hypothetical protein